MKFWARTCWNWMSVPLDCRPWGPAGVVVEERPQGQLSGLPHVRASGEHDCFSMAVLKAARLWSLVVLGLGLALELALHPLRGVSILALPSTRAGLFCTLSLPIAACLARAWAPSFLLVLQKEVLSLSHREGARSLHLTSFAIDAQTLTFVPQGEAAFPSAAGCQSSPRAEQRRGTRLAFLLPELPQIASASLSCGPALSGTSVPSVQPGNGFLTWKRGLSWLKLVAEGAELGSWSWLCCCIGA